jgi:hypothetical protein
MNKYPRTEKYKLPILLLVIIFLTQRKSGILPGFDDVEFLNADTENQIALFTMVTVKK